MKKSSNTSSTTSNSKMDEQINIKVVRLHSGEDVIADVITDEEFTILNNPMVVVLRRSPTGSVMMMSPWLPVELISDNIATIKNTEILTLVEPKDSLVEYYLTRVGQTIIEVENSDEMLKKYNDSLSDGGDYLDTFLDSNDNYEETYEDEETTMEELMNSLQKPTDKSQLH